jgi:predicted transcriptional regulator
MQAQSGVGPHLLEQFADELDMHKVTVSKALQWLVSEGLISRYGGNGDPACSRYIDPVEVDTVPEAIDPLRESL